MDLLSARLLVVDEDEALLLKMMQLFIPKGLTGTYTASNIEDGREFFYEVRPQVVIISTDLHNGKWFLQEIKHSQNQAFCIIFTTVDNPEFLDFCKSIGADACFVKPFDDKKYQEIENLVMDIAKRTEPTKEAKT